MGFNQQTTARDRQETVAFRVSEDRKHLIRAAAARHEMLPSDWLRVATEEALQREFGVAVAERK